ARFVIAGPGPTCGSRFSPRPAEDRARATDPAAGVLDLPSKQRWEVRPLLGTKYLALPISLAGSCHASARDRFAEGGRECAGPRLGNSRRDALWGDLSFAQ